MSKLFQIQHKRKDHAANIGGKMDYAVLARLNQPKDTVALTAEVRRLRTTGLKAIDISVALRLNLAAVHEMLAGADYG